MDKVSPAFESTVVETRSWDNDDCNQLEEHLDIDTCSPTTFTTSRQIAEAHSVVDINSIPPDEDSAPYESDCSISKVLTPSLLTKQDNVGAETIDPTSGECAQQVEEPVISGSNIKTEVSDVQLIATSNMASSIPTFREESMNEVEQVDSIQPTAETNSSPMLFGSFVAPGKANPNIIVSLEAADLWHQFYQAGTEMIITKSGR